MAEGFAGRLRPVVIDISSPLLDVHTLGAEALWVTVVAAGQPLGRLIVPSPSDPCPAGYLARLLAPYGTLARREALQTQFERGVRPVGASVVVCTRDRPDALRRCLAALKDQTLPPSQTLVIDNGSGGGPTEPVVRSFGLEYIHEPEPGLDRARNRGWTESRGEIIAFTDDDVEVHPDWLAHLARCFQHPLTAAATGIVLPARFDTEGQHLFEEHAGFVRGLEPLVLDGAHDAPTSAGVAGAGASMAVRRNFLEEIGGFPEALDAGMPTRTGGDTAVLYRVLRRGRRIRYEPRAMAFHTHRESIGALHEAVRGYGTGTLSYLAEAAIEERDLGAAIAAVRWVGSRGKKFATASVKGRRTERNLLATELLGMAQAPRALPAARRLAGRRTTPPRATASPWQPTQIAGAPLAVRRDEWDGFPALSIVIPSRGRSRSLSRLLTRLADQEYPKDRLQVIVSIDGDIDGSGLAVDRMDLEVEVVVSDRGGPGLARNRGAARASGDLVLFLDDDVEPAHRLLLVEHGRSHRDGADAAVGMITPASADQGDLASVRIRNWWLDHAAHLMETKEVTFDDVSSGNLSIGRRLFAELKGFADLPRHEDWELGYRIARSGARLTVACRAEVSHPVQSSFDEILDDRYDEGRGDVEFVRRHPELFALLPVGGWDDYTSKLRRIARQAIRSPEHSMRLARSLATPLRALESTGERRRYSKAMTIANTLAYWAGVGIEAGGLREWHALAARGRAARCEPLPRIELTEAASWERPPAPHGAVIVEYSGTPLGTAPLRWGGSPWSRDAFGRALIRRFASETDVVEAERGLTS